MWAIRKIAGGRFTLILVFGGLILLSLGSSPPAVEMLSREMKAVSDGNSTFALNLFSKLPNSNANQVVSPFHLLAFLRFSR